MLSLQRSCGDKSTEVACAADIDEVLPAGTYFLSVDGKTAHDFGKYKLDWKVEDTAVLEAACNRAATLAPGQTVTGNTKGLSHKFTTSCGGRPDDQGSPDTVYRVNVPARQHAKLELTTPQHDGVLAIRRACGSGPRAGNNSDIQCNMRADDTHHTRLDLMLDPGTYYVVVDGHGALQSGPFSLTYQVVK